jgi:hypothetical protein
MDTKLLFPELDSSPEKDKITENIQNEIEFPRCFDTMILSSDFDRFLFFCQECKLSFLVK